MSEWNDNYGGWNNGSDSYTTPESAEAETSTAVEEPTGDVNAAAEKDEDQVMETASSNAASTESKDTKPTRKTKAAARKELANLDEKDVKRLYDMIVLLQDDETAVAVAKLMTGSRKSEPFALVSALTNGRNASRVKRFKDIAERLSSAGSIAIVGIRLPLLFENGKTGVEDVFALLNAVAPDRDFGRVNKPERAKYGDYAEQIVEKWGDGVDLSIVSKLVV